MGVLNVTPDSFSDGGLYLDADRAVERARQMVAEGARLIDIGGASSRPRGQAYGAGAPLVPADEELRRVLPVVAAVAQALPDVWISVDTFRSDVAEAALAAGAHMINDITALRFDPRLGRVCAEADAPLVLMHSVGLPGDMPHEQPVTDVLSWVNRELRKAVDLAGQSGCRQLVLDPGFGFGKTPEDNLRLMAGVPTLLAQGFPVLVGVSRKSSIAWAARTRLEEPLLPPEERMPGSLAAAGVAVQRGAAIVRTHDVAETVQYLRVLDRTLRSGADIPRESGQK